MSLWLSGAKDAMQQQQQQRGHCWLERSTACDFAMPCCEHRACMHAMRARVAWRGCKDAAAWHVGVCLQVNVGLLQQKCDPRT